MEKQIATPEHLFQLVPTTELPGVSTNTLTVGRYLVGRTETCDVVIPVKGVSAVHAVLEITPKGVKVYDMNSKNGTSVDGNKVVAKNVELNGRISFSKVEFILKKYKANPDLPPVLPSLDPVKGHASVLKSKLPVTPELPAERPTVAEEVPYIIYPLSADPSSAYSEYIFEDKESLYPIFKYNVSKQAVEIIILFKDKVFSVDYLPEEDGLYKIAGLTDRKDEVEFPYLGAKESVPFVEMKSGNCVVQKLHNYEILHLVDSDIKKASGTEVNLQGNEIVKLSNGDLEIFVRKVSSPPEVKSPPFFRKDNDLLKYMLLILFFLSVPLVGLHFYEPEEKIDDEKDAERVARILYKQKLLINKNRKVQEATKKKPIQKQKAPKKPVIKKTEPKKTQTNPQKTLQKLPNKVKDPGSRKAPVRQRVKVAKNPAPKVNKNVKSAKSAASARRGNTAATRRANVNSKSQGKVKAYKTFNFKSSVNNLMAKGGQIRGARTANTSSNSISSSNVTGGVSTNVSKANVGTDVGNLTGSTEGKLADTKGTKGLSAKSGAYTAGIPSETVVLGSMDPDVIRRILRDNIPFFRSCYQKELNRNSGKNIAGTIRLNFVIGSRGYVTRAGVGGRTRLPKTVKRCVVGVLRGIEFPRPLGGGTVDVKQPFNFYPKKL